MNMIGKLLSSSTLFQGGNSTVNLLRGPLWTGQSNIVANFGGPSKQVMNKYSSGYTTTLQLCRDPF